MARPIVSDEVFEARFWSRVRKSGPDECWEWTACRYTTGYGAITKNGRNLHGHRLAWQYTFGPIPPGLFVCHRCDNKGCCNPAHLFIGTCLENTRDMIRKGRARHDNNRKGERHYKARLTEADVREIISLKNSGLGAKVLGVRFGVSAANIGSIWGNHIWRHIPR